MYSNTICTPVIWSGGVGVSAEQCGKVPCPNVKLSAGLLEIFTDAFDVWMAEDFPYSSVSSSSSFLYTYLLLQCPSHESSRVVIGHKCVLNVL